MYGLTIRVKAFTDNSEVIEFHFLQVGEIGWDVSSIRKDHTKLWRSGHQIKVVTIEH